MHETTKDAVFGLLLVLAGATVFIAEFTETGTASALVLVLAGLVMAVGLGIAVYSKAGPLKRY